MNIYRQLTANNVILRDYPFAKELLLEAYLIDNESILNLSNDEDNDFFGAEIIGEEYSIKGSGVNGRIDLLVKYNSDYLGVVELKAEEININALKQLKGYLEQRDFILEKYKEQLEQGKSEEIDDKNIKFIGILVGTSISVDLLQELEKNEYQISINKTKIPIACMVVKRFRSDDRNEIFVVSDIYFNLKSNKALDRTQYEFKGKEYGKGRLVLAVVQDVVKNKKIGIKKLEELFPPDEIKSNIFVTREKGIEIVESARTKTKRHFIKDDECITLDGIQYVVSNEWGKTNIKKNKTCLDTFIKYAKKHGYKIKEVGKKVKK